MSEGINLVIWRVLINQQEKYKFPNKWDGQRHEQSQITKEEIKKPHNVKKNANNRENRNVSGWLTKTSVMVQCAETDPFIYSKGSGKLVLSFCKERFIFVWRALKCTFPLVQENIKGNDQKCYK